MATPIVVPAFAPTISAGARYFKNSQKDRVPPEDSSNLLRSIKAALQAAGKEPNPPFRSVVTYGGDDAADGEDEISWNDHTVVWSTGGVLRRKWSFEEEGQQIQYACIARTLQPGIVSSGRTANSAKYIAGHDSDGARPSNEKSSNDTFSPFFRKSRQKVTEPVTFWRGVYVFLRSFGKILLFNGVEHTFSLPFIVRQAWPVRPHGVLIQRVLEDTELNPSDAESDEFVLPTLFTLTNPFEEPRAVGVREKIHGGFYEVPPDLDRNAPEPGTSLEFVPSGEHVLGISSRKPNAGLDIVVTINQERKKLSFWHYAHEQSKSVPSPPSVSTTKHATNRKKMATPFALGASHQFTSTQEMAARGDRIREPSPDVYEDTQPIESSETPLGALPGMPPSLSNTTTLASLSNAPSSGLPAQWPPNGSAHIRRNSFTRNDLSSTMDRMIIGRRSDIGLPDTVTEDTIQPAYWMAKLFELKLSDAEAIAWKRITFSVYDHRQEGDGDRSCVALCSPATETVTILELRITDDNYLKMTPKLTVPGIGVLSVKATRAAIWDLLLLKPDNQLSIVTYGGFEVPIEVKPCSFDIQRSTEDDLSVHDYEGDRSMASVVDCQKIISIRDAIHSCATVVFEDGSRLRINVNLVPSDPLTGHVIKLLAGYMPADKLIRIQFRFWELWSGRDWSRPPEVQFDCLSQAILNQWEFCGSVVPTATPGNGLWFTMAQSPSASRLRNDTALLSLDAPDSTILNIVPNTTRMSQSDKSSLFALLAPLHLLGEQMRLFIPSFDDLSRLARLIVQLARSTFPGWADYWKRLYPDVAEGWSQPGIESPFAKDDSTWPHDYSAALFSRIAGPEGGAGLTELISNRTVPRFTSFGVQPVHQILREVVELYDHYCDYKQKDGRRRAENTVLRMVQLNYSSDYLSLLTHAVATPLREAARTCQIGPPPTWPIQAYEFVGRNDLTEAVLVSGDILFNDGYRTLKDHLNPRIPRTSYRALFEEAHRAVHHGDEIVTGVELDLADFMDIRFGQDRRLQEVARMLRSSVTPTIRMQERAELSEHELAKEQQAQVLRTAERTLSLPLGRAMFTFGSVPTVTKEVYTVPRIELAIRVTPYNTIITPEPGKIPLESLQWAEFHNGVAAALRISPSTSTVDSSWISFNKPNELTPEHAGFLFGLGLTGHLKEMLTWHTFGYLTPKHDLTSIGVLLGLSAANVGTGNRHVTKLLAVHTPALLPTEGVDLNVPLLTQASGLVGIGLLYVGSKNRRMAEVALHQLSRKDLMLPDISNEYREAYTLAAALSFGMIMLGRGAVTSSPADMTILSTLRVLVHGNNSTTSQRATVTPVSFDVNLTSPAATLALGLMFLKTNRQDVADILTIPDTTLALNSIQPSFLLIRTLCRALIMWDNINPTKEWIRSQVPEPIDEAVEARSAGKPIEDAMELAYYNIVSGCCFAIGLKYAGTAREEAYTRIIEYHDFFSRSAHHNSLAFDHKIKRAAIRDGLNLASLSLNMVMAGTGEINCLRRLRYAHGMYNTPIRYGSHMATHMSLGLLFLGGGRFTLGNSDAAIACMVVAFYPRFPAVSSDNKSYLQALRHLWVLAVEPRCLIARDVDTREVVYLPTKIRFKEGTAIAGSQMISPTLIPSLDRLLSIKVDTPRYWPFLLDIANNTRHREVLLRSQTLFVKRRTMFLSYQEDPKGSRSLFVRSGLSTGEAASLDHPQLVDATSHPASDLQQFITSHSNNISFISFADKFCRSDGNTSEEKTFNSFCHAALLDCIIQDKPQILSSYLHIYHSRIMDPRSCSFQNIQQDLFWLSEFYSRLFPRRYSGGSEGISRPALLRENSVISAVNAVGQRLKVATERRPELLRAIGAYVLDQMDSPDLRRSASNYDLDHHIAWYLSKHSVPYAPYLPILRSLALMTLERLSQEYPPNGIKGTEKNYTLEEGVKFIVHQSVCMSARVSTYWSIESFEHILRIWKNA